MRIIRTYKETGRVPNVVNLARRTPATHMLVVRHRDRPGVLAHVFDHLREADLNVQETENIVFEGAEAAVARINLDGAPPRGRCAIASSGQRGRARPPGGAALTRARCSDRSERHDHATRARASSISPRDRPCCRSRCSRRRSANLLALPGVGMSMLEISHRSKPFDEIIEGCEARLRTLAGIPDGYHVLFLQGGASLQFSMVPMNLLPAGRLRRLHRDRRLVAEGGQGSQARRRREDRRHRPRPRTSSACRSRRELTLDPGAAYVHYTTNNTIFGTEFGYVPDVGAVPLVADTSSDIFSRPIDVSKFGLIYAGAQKNLAPAGVTLVDHPRRLLKRTPASLPTMLQYRCTWRTSRSTTRRRCSRFTSCAWC